jgi:protein SCO1/2
MAGGGSAFADDFGPGALPADQLPRELENIGVVEHVGDVVPGEIMLRDEAGHEVKVSSYLKGDKPLVLNFVYHQCPTLCSFVLNGFTNGLKDVPWAVGEQYEILTVSIDPRDTPQIAGEKKAARIAQYGRAKESAQRGWHFLTGDAREVKRLADSVGFRYEYDPKDQQFAHSAAVIVLSPDGKISRYLYGIEFPGRDLHLSMLEASAGRTSLSLHEQAMLYCYRYDPAARSYVLVALNVVRLSGALTVLLLGGFLGILWRRERKSGEPPAPGDDVKTPAPAGLT